ncbi:MAG TPA: M48 family metalloprotease [Candidatus Sulfotelmatobacter sp.]|nr:M48 family metalloprotease [Candidatus Sulfotelmatobacter sp.]
MRLAVRIVLDDWRACIAVAILLSARLTLPAAGQDVPDTPEVPRQFHVDTEAAARLQPQLMAQSGPAAGRYDAARLVFERLTKLAVPPADVRIAWQLRIVQNDRLNAYSSPDGTVYVETGLAQIAGPSTGLWAAILAHEIAHITRRDWARRYLAEKSLQSEGSATVLLGDPGLPGSAWTDPQKASQDLARFCRRLEIEADRDSLLLMARAGYHPDFVPALHHLLHAQGSDAPVVSLSAMHPCWEQRDRELTKAYVAASIEFDRRWPEWYASPGGNPPIVVFAEDPKVRKTGSGSWEIEVPMRCQNLAGAVEVVLRSGTTRTRTALAEPLPDQAAAGTEMRQLTGCTSPRTTITFPLNDGSSREKPARWTDVYVLDAWGTVLARADVPKLPR